MAGLGLSFTDLVDKLVSREKLWIILQFFEHVCNLLWIQFQVRLKLNQVLVCLFKSSEYLTYFELVHHIKSMIE